MILGVVDMSVGALSYGSAEQIRSAGRRHGGCGPGRRNPRIVACFAARWARGTGGYRHARQYGPGVGWRPVARAGAFRLGRAPVQFAHDYLPHRTAEERLAFQPSLDLPEDRAEARHPAAPG